MIEIRQGDSLKLIKKVPDNSVDLVITDPPYGIDFAKWDVFKPKILDELLRVMKEGGALFMWFSQMRVGYIQAEIEKRLTLKSIIIERKSNMVVTTWDKGKLQIQWEPIFYAVKGKAKIDITKRKWELELPLGDVWDTVTPQTNYNGNKEKQHPCQKSVGTCENAVLLQSDPGDLVMDPFCGSGTTGIACKMHGRNFLGFEQSKKWAKMAEDRINATPDPIFVKTIQPVQLTIEGKHE